MARFRSVTGVRRRAWCAVSLALGAVVLAGCAGLAGPRTVTLGEAELARMIERQFPAERRVLELIDVRIASPRVRLVPATNRLATDLDISASARGMPRSYQGRLSLDYALRLDPEGQAVRLSQVRVNRLQLEGVPPAMQSTVDKLGPLVAEQLLKDLPIYRFRPEDLKAAAGRGYAPSAVTVTAHGVEITLAPK